MLLAQYGDMEWEAGVDEAGRGCLAGPVFAAAVIFPKGYKNNLLNDSKKLSEKLRYSLREEILKEAISYGVASVDASEIDQINILQASIKAMHKAATQLNPQPNYLIVDGNRFKPYNNIPYSCIVKGDA
ncbi:MAG: ribonuclease HII, partial [Bacteroidales bacterium]